jgi:hypothetical protein
MLGADNFVTFFILPKEVLNAEIIVLYATRNNKVSG